jgi:polyferredoxin
MSTAVDPTRSAQCARCGTAFQCGVDEPGGCWCARLPSLPADALDGDAGCLCRRCLDGVLAKASRFDGP